MPIINRLVSARLRGRLKAIERFKEDPIGTQHQQFELLSQDQNRYLAQFGDVSSYDKFHSRVPIVTYEEFSQNIDKALNGDHEAIWSGEKFRWAAKSSGTTASASKYIPINKRYLNNCHYRGGRDSIALFLKNNPRSKALTGRGLTLGGSAKIEIEGGLKTGDLSAILIENTPAPISWIREPKTKVALISDFEEKITAICKATANKNVTSFAGVPSWNLILMQRILEYTGKKSIHEVWPNMSVFFHGGIAFEPYREEYKKIFNSPKMQYMETYNASEGFFAMQDEPEDSAMLLMLDYEIFYEFIPMSSLYDHSTVVPLSEVKTGVNYAMIISTSSGLWRYLIGDTVEFTSTAPYKIKITGRTKSFINAFGEEVIVDNADRAIKSASDATGTAVKEYTAAPIFMEDKEKGAHEWIIECDIADSQKELFCTTLDKTLQAVNSDYAAKRSNNATLNAPVIHFAPSGTFTRWLGSRGKLGGQNKVPRLSNNRTHLDKILKFL